MGYQIYVKSKISPRFEIWEYKIYSTRLGAMIALQGIKKSKLAKKYERGSKWDIRKVRTVKKTSYAQRLNRLTRSV